MQLRNLILGLFVLTLSLASHPGIAQQAGASPPVSAEHTATPGQGTAPEHTVASEHTDASKQSAVSEHKAAPEQGVLSGAAASVSVKAGKPESIDPIYIRNVRTYDYPENEGDPDLPRKVFVLEVQAGSSYAPVSDILLDTNAGFGLMLGTLGGSLADSLREVEISCYNRRPSPDDCSPEAIVIYNASGALDRYDADKHARTDITERLRRNADTYRQFETANGVLPQPAAASGKSKGKGKKRQEILLAFEGECHIRSSRTVVQLTFPPGEKKNYTNPTLLTSWGFNSSESVFEDPGKPDSYFLGLSESVFAPNSPEYVPKESGKLGRSGIYIREAYAWRNGKKVNILPLLVENSFRMLPIHGPSGDLLPLGPENNIYWPESKPYWGSETP